ncbi:MAG: hypothetical protein H0W70_03170 [Actinobacteria bacterium]|nr:hypothetical protein [Actinomycetota bacterium]
MSRRSVFGGVAAAVALAVIGASALDHGGGSGKVSARASRPTTSLATAADRSGPAVAAAGSTPPADASAASSAVKAEVYPGGGATAVPLSVKASSTEGLRDGDVVSIHVEPKKGAVVYGFEAWLCKGGETYQTDADLRPTFAGKCASKPLSANSDRFKEVRAAPPYAAADGLFRVGTGTDTYATRDGRMTTVACGPARPCSLVLKLQFPYGFGFEAIPLTFR